MDTRRNFIKISAITLVATSLPLQFPSTGQATYPVLKTHKPQRALVLFYSQTGHTRRYGRLIACLLKSKGIAVDLRDMQAFDKSQFPVYELIIIGTPVFYYDIPSNVSEWLATMPSIKGTPVAAYVSFGGPEGNQHNALCHTLRLLTAGGGVPVGMDAYRSLPSYPTPKWDGPNQLAARHLPNEMTFDQVRRFSSQILERIARIETISINTEIAIREYLSMLPLVWFNKKVITKHTVDKDKCIGCQTCVRKCPTQAINPSAQTVDKDKCLACFGCLNNCPADAVVIEYRGQRLYGFPEYLRRNRLTIMEPPEFQTCSL